MNEHLYLDDDDDIAPTPGPQVEYDGMTIRLRAHVFVEPQQEHAIRIVIADVDGSGGSDFILDSGIFLGEGSVLTREPVP